MRSIVEQHQPRPHRVFEIHDVQRGGILVEKPHGVHFGRQRTPRIVIGPEATVQGTLRFDREVELFVHPTAKIGTVVGAKAQAWTDKLPPRRDD